jgi:hypothetical protein
LLDISTGILNNFETNNNFWKVNKQLCIPEEFESFRYNDRSRDKEESSKIMWAIALLLDPDSKFKRLRLQDRKTLIAKDYIKNEKFQWDKYKDIILMYEKLILTPAQRQLSELERKLDERTEFLNNTPYNDESYEMIEKIRKNTSDWYDDLERIKDKLEREDDGGVTKGGSEESAVEKGLM